MIRTKGKNLENDLTWLLYLLGNILAEWGLSHSCANRNPDTMGFSCVDCRFGGSDTLALDRSGRADLLIRQKCYSAGTLLEKVKKVVILVTI